MPKFRSAFNKWARHYDEQVTRASPTEDWMFGGYDAVLDKAAAFCEMEKNHYASVLDIGAGTGNLAARFLKSGRKVYAIEPSKKMREACAAKYPDITIAAGDFLKYPRNLKPIDVIVSSYAFHHLKEKEKTRSVALMKERLKPGGRIVIVDFMYQDEAAVPDTVRSLKEKWGADVQAAFKGEFPAYHDDIVAVFQQHGFKVDGEQTGVFTWIIRACL